MHDAARSFVQSVLASTAIPKGPVIEIGGRDINGTIRPLFHGLGPYVSIDLREGPGVNLVADVCTLRPQLTVRRLFGRSTVTCVVCCEVLEHAENARGICAWAARVLAQHGVFIVTAANPQRFTHSGVDGGNVQPGEYYCGVSEAMLTAWLMPFRRHKIVQHGADIYAVAWKIPPV